MASTRAHRLWIVIAPFAAALVLCAVALITSRRSTPAPAVDRTPPPRLEGEMQLLRRQMQAFAQRETARMQSAAEPGPAPTTPAPPSLSRDEVELRERRHFDYIERKLAAEPVDAAWAGATERLIAEALKDQVFAGSTLEDARCHSTLCRFELTHKSPTAEHRLRGLLPQRLPSLPSGSLRSAGGNPPRTIVYVAREGHHVPRDGQE